MGLLSTGDPRESEDSSLPFGCSVAAIVALPLVCIGKLFMKDALERGHVTWMQILIGIGVLLAIGFAFDRWRAHRRVAPPSAPRAFTTADLGSAYLVEVQTATDGPRHRRRLTVAADGLRLVAVGKTPDASFVAAADLWSVRVAHQRFELRSSAQASPTILLASSEDSDRLAWELACRFPDAMERGLSAA